MPSPERRRGKKPCLLLAALLLAALLLAITAPEGASPATPPAATAPAATPPDTTACARLGGTLRVALTGKFPPFSFYGKNGELQGFDVDVARAVAAELGCREEIITTEWDGILVGLLVGSYDAIIGSMAITPERAAKVDFSRPYYVSGPQLFVRSNEAEEIGGIADMAGKRIGVGLGETYEQFLRRHHSEIEVRTYKGMPEIYQEMVNGRLSAFFTDRLVGLHQIAAGALPFVPVGELLYRERIGIPVRPDAAWLVGAIDQALEALEREGKMSVLRRKWFGDDRTGAPAAGMTGKAPAAARPASAAGYAPAAAGREENKEAGMPKSVIARRLARGFGVTLMVAGISIAFGFLLAVPYGWLLHQRRSRLYPLLRWSNDFVRATPLLIQLFFVYFGAPQLGILLAPLQAAVITLSLNAAAYMAETVRSGLLAVPAGQRLAAAALGLRPLQIFRFVVWPQAFRVALPNLVSNVVALTKDTALVSVIAVAEVIRETQSIISVTYAPLEYYSIAAALFFAITFPLMKLAERLEQRIAARGYAR